MPEPVITKEAESKNPTILGDKICRKGSYWSGWSEPDFQLGGNDHTSTHIERTSREEVERTKESYKTLIRSMTDFSLRIKPKEGEILVRLERLITPPSFIPHWYHAEIGISGKKFEDMRVIDEHVYTSRNQSAEWVDKKQLLADVQNFLLRNPQGMAWLREMEENDGLFQKIKPKD